VRGVGLHYRRDNDIVDAAAFAASVDDVDASADHIVDADPDC
jgi:hypothetical protein